MPSIPGMFPMSTVGKSFTPKGETTDKAYTRRVRRFFDEFEWYTNALKAQRKKGVPY